MGSEALCGSVSNAVIASQWGDQIRGPMESWLAFPQEPYARRERIDLEQIDVNRG